MVGKISSEQGRNPLEALGDQGRAMANISMSDQFKATLEVVDQFSRMSNQAAAAGAATQEAYHSVKNTAADVGKKIGEAIGDLPAAWARLQADLQKRDAADRLEKGVLAGIKGLMTFTYFSTLFIPTQVISTIVGIGVASIGMYEWSRGEGGDKMWQGLSLGVSPSRLLVNLIKTTFNDSQTVTNQSFNSTFENVDNQMDDIFKVDREKATLFEKGVVVLSKGFLLSGGVALAVPASILSTIIGAASVPSGGWDRGTKIALLPAMTAGALFKSIAIDVYIMGKGAFASPDFSAPS